MKFYLSTILLLIRNPYTAFQQIISSRLYWVVIFLLSNLAISTANTIFYDPLFSLGDLLILYSAFLIFFGVALFIGKLFVQKASFAEVFLVLLWADVFHQIIRLTEEASELFSHIAGLVPVIQFSVFIEALIAAYSVTLFIIGLRELRKKAAMAEEQGEA